MFIRGSGAGQEHRREDNSFYRGIVVKNNDPLRMNRVKVYIPELTNQPFDDWFEKHSSINVKAPGKNNKSDTWVDTKMFEEIAGLIPWAEPCSPIMGESGNYRYNTDKEISFINDCNYEEGFEINNDSTPSINSGGFSPAYLYENMETAIDDSFSQPLDNFSGKCNPYSYSYRPSKHVNKSKGVFGIPEVGSKVWVFHYTGDLNFPVYMGVSHDYRELTLINNNDNESKLSFTYPSDFEN